MTNAQTIDRLHALAQMLPTDERIAFDYARKHPGEKFPLDSLGISLARFLDTVEHESKKQTAKNGGQLARFRAMERIIKRAKQDHRPALWGAWTVDGSQYVCDSFRLVRLSDPLDLPTIPDNVEPIDAARILEPSAKNEGARLELPDPAALRAYIKTEKARHKGQRNAPPPSWDFGDDLPRVNAQYLLDMLEIFPESVAICSKSRPLLSAIYFQASDGDGILLPARKS